MLKLYKEIDGQLHYWETWTDEKITIVHWGKVGERGQKKRVWPGLFSNIKAKIQKKIESKRKEGYAEIDDDLSAWLEIEYVIDDFGELDDLDKRHKLEERLDELLGWTGLGQTNGGSIGSGTMEVGCNVVDFDIAKKVIEQDLKGTEFKDYARIFRKLIDG